MLSFVYSVLRVRLTDLAAASRRRTGGKSPLSFPSGFDHCLYDRIVLGVIGTFAWHPTIPIVCASPDPPDSLRGMRDETLKMKGIAGFDPMAIAEAAVDLKHVLGIAGNLVYRL